MSQGRALVADDTVTMTNYVRSLLGKMGYHAVDTARDGAEALRLIGSQSYDLIVLDHNMPSVNGLDVIRAVRRSMPQLKAAIVLMTGLVNRQMIDAIRDENLAVDAVLAKPFDAAMFAGKIEAKCGKRPTSRVTARDDQERPAPARPTASISARRCGDLFAIRFAGTVTHNDKLPIKHAFDQALSDDGPQVAVDVSDLIAFDEFFLGFLLVFCGTAAKPTRDVALVTGPRSQGSRMFSLGVDRIVPAVVSLTDLRRAPAN